MYTIVSLLLAGLSFLVVNAGRVAVVQIFRHGQRTPVSFYPNDPYKNSDVWNGMNRGELTNTGKLQHFYLGKLTRDIYSGFLSGKYNSSQFRIETSNVGRTHMSAQTNVYGIFPAKGEEVWHPNLNWQPIPINPSDESIWSSTYYPVTCEIFLKLLAEVLLNDEYKALNKKYQRAYKILSKHSGKVVYDVVGAMEIWDALKSEDSLGLRLPYWTKKIYPEPLHLLAGHAFASSTYTIQMKRIVIGPFLNEIVKYFNTMVEDPTSAPKLKLYSGHDTNIAAVLNTFRAFEPPYPPAFASSIYFELHKDGSEYYVKVFSKDGDNLKQISVNGCQLNCTFSDFKFRLDDIIVDVATRDNECKESAIFMEKPAKFETKLIAYLTERLQNLRT